MALHDFPIIKLELQGMRATIHAMLMEQTAKLDESIKAALDEAIASFDYGAEVKRMAHDAIRAAIRTAMQRELEYGPSYEVLAEIARDMIKKSLKPAAVKARRR